MKSLATLAGTLLLAISQAASAVPLLTNGNFEAGLAGWTVTDQAGGSGSWFAETGTVMPISGGTTVGPLPGSTTYAVTDQGGPGTHALTQSFTVAPGASSVILRFNMFVNSYAPFTDNGGVLDYLPGPAQFGRVDLLTETAGAFDTGLADVLQNFYLNIDDPLLNPNPYTAYEFNITPLVGAGGTFQLRFAEVDNQLFLNMGVDNVDITALYEEVPEPGSLALLALGTGALALARRRRPA